MSYTSITKMQNLHDEAIRGLLFYKEELDILETRLAEVAQKNTSWEARQGIEHFQNQFIIQRNNIDELKHRINLHVQDMSKESSNHAGRIPEEQVKKEKELSTEYLGLEKIINEMRQEFNKYLSKWM